MAGSSLTIVADSRKKFDFVLRYNTYVTIVSFFLRVCDEVGRGEEGSLRGLQSSILPYILVDSRSELLDRARTPVNQTTGIEISAGFHH